MKYDLFKNNDDNEFEIRKNKYNFGFVDGMFGDGKTVFLTNFGVQNKDYYKRIYSNYNINLDNCVYLPKINKHVILNLNQGNDKCLLLLQESYTYFDRRYNMRKQNKDIMEAICQIRKTNIDVFADIPQLEFLDSRILIFSTHYVTALGELKKYRGVFYYQKKILKYLMRIEPVFLNQNKFIIDMKSIYSYYNHLEKTVKQQSLTIDGIF